MVARQPALGRLRILAPGTLPWNSISEGTYDGGISSGAECARGKGEVMIQTIFPGADGKFDLHFDGPVAERGDQVVLVCYYVSGNEMRFRLQVIQGQLESVEIEAQ